MLYLRSKEDPSKVEELRHLIFDEIDHRNRFIYCKSPNAETSTWVSQEIEYIKSKDRIFETLKKIQDDDLDAVIIPYSCFDRIPISKNFLIKVKQEKIEQLNESIRRKKKTPTVKQRIKNPKQKNTIHIVLRTVENIIFPSLI